MYLTSLQLKSQCRVHTTTIKFNQASSDLSSLILDQVSPYRRSSLFEQSHLIKHTCQVYLIVCSRIYPHALMHQEESFLSRQWLVSVLKTRKCYKYGCAICIFIQMRHFLLTLDKIDILCLIYSNFCLFKFQIVS